MKTLIKGFLIGCAFVAILAPCFWGAYHVGLFNISSVEVGALGGVGSVGFELVKKRVEDQLAVHKGSPIWSVGIDEVTSLVKSEKWVRDLRVSRAFPNRLKVWIESKEIAALTFDGEQKVIPVGIDGSLLSPLSGGQIPSAPYLTGKNLFESDQLRKQAVTLLEQLPNKGFFSQESVSEVLYRKEFGFIAVINQGGYEVLLGEEINPEKVEQINQVLTYVQSKSVNARVIDARLSKKVLVRLRKRP